MTEMFSIYIDGKELRAKAGDSVLQVALDNGIYIPNLCYLPGAQHPEASCRLCFVEIEGRPAPVTSCTEPVKPDMQVKTDTPRVRRLQRTAAELLISRHHVNCGECPRNKNCELQKIAIFLKVKLKGGRFRKLEKELPVDEGHPCLVYDANKCVLCGRCVNVCRAEGKKSFNFAFRGAKTIVRNTCKSTPEDLSCSVFGACAEVCPTAALLLRKEPDGEVAAASPKK